MRGYDSRTEALFTYVTPESFVPKERPLRAIRKMADTALAGMDKLFDSIRSCGDAHAFMHFYQFPPCHAETSPFKGTNSFPL
jgi:hypothetical protein